MQPQLDSRNCLNIFILYDPLATAVLMISTCLEMRSGLCNLGICGWCEWLEGGYGEEHGHVTAHIWAASCEAIETAVRGIVACRVCPANRHFISLAQYKRACGM